MKVTNIMERVVRDKLELMLAKEENCCSCDQCVSDMICIALNKLKPKYVNSEKGAMITKVSQISVQDEIDILNIVVESFVIVQKNPRH